MKNPLAAYAAEGRAFMRKNTVQPMILTALLAALTAVGAFVRIGVPPVMFTLQTFFTATAGLLLGARHGAASQAVYVLLGLLGLPIFTEGGGLMYIAKPTFGFLLGLIPMAFIIGLLTKKDCGFWRLLSAEAAGLAAMYAVGLPYLYFALGGAWTVGQTVVSGCLVFLPFDFLKLVFAALLGTRLRRQLTR